MMQTSLIDKLHRFNPERPYVWELKITEDEFSSLEDELRGYTPDATKKDDALKMVVYVAEWYKRSYTNRDKKAYQKTFGGMMPDLETAWKTLGIDEKYLYRGEGDQRLRLFSTFILGGLAVNFELQKAKSNDKFIKNLCRLLNGEDDSFEKLVDPNHPIAFRESVKKEHCLYAYLKTIVDFYNEPEKLPFAIEDYKQADTNIKELVDLIKTINDSVKKSKFRLEWIINAQYGDNLITRTLHLWLNPNKGDASKRHVYSNEDIQVMWGVPKSEDQHYLRIGLRFIKQVGKDDIVVQEANPQRPVITFRNTGDTKIGFIASEADYAVVKRVPVYDFNVVEIVCWDDDNNRFSIVRENVNFDAIQLYRIEQFEDFWTDRSLPKRETTVLFSDKYTISEESDDKDFATKTLYNKYYGEGITYNWCPVNIAVIFQDKEGKRLDPFVSKQGTNRIYIHQYKETIQYTLDGKVEWHQKDLEEDTETNDFVSFVAKKDDILAFFTQKQDEGEEDKIEKISPDLIQFKGVNGRYIDWDDDNEPSVGINYIKVYARHKLINNNEKAYPIFYLPGGIVRDCEQHTIKNGKTLLLDDSNNIKECIDRRQTLSPTIGITIKAGETDTIDVTVYRPVKLKEVCYDGKILDYIEEGAYELPYILHNHIVLHSYGENGYKEFNCAYLTGIHKLIYEKRKNNPNAAWASSAAWENGDTYKASDIDVDAPDFLMVKIGERLQKDLNNEEFYFWDYDQDHPLVKLPRRGVTAPEDWGIVFQSNKSNRTGKNFYPLYNEEDDDIFEEDSEDHFKNVSIIQCFKIAIEHELYFFTLTPLKILSEEEFDKKLLIPILKEYEDAPPPEICMGLRRFVEEYDYQDKDKYYSIINQKI